MRLIVSGQPQPWRILRQVVRPPAVLCELAVPGRRQGPPHRRRPRPGNARNAPLNDSCSAPAAPPRASFSPASPMSVPCRGGCSRRQVMVLFARAGQPDGLSLAGGSAALAGTVLNARACLLITALMIHLVCLCPPRTRVPAPQKTPLCVRVPPAGAYDGNCTRPVDGYPV